MKNVIRFLSVLLLALTGCSDDECDFRHPDSLLGLPVIKQGTFPEKDLDLKVGEAFEYAPEVNSPIDVYYQWYKGEDDMGTDTRYFFKAERPSRSRIRLELTNDYGKVAVENNIIVPGADYTGGCLILNEGWFGHESGSISYYDYTAKTIEHWAYKNQNFGNTLGTTSQSATLWNGKLYVCSKQDNHLVVVDPKTLYVEKDCGKLLRTAQVYEFIGLNQDYGLLTASGDIYRIDLNTYEVVHVTTGNTWKGCGSAVVAGDKLLLNVNGQKLYVMDMAKLLGDLSQYDYKNQFPYTQLDVMTSGGCRFVSGKDGNVYTVESTGSENKLVRIKPDLSVEKMSLRSDYSPSFFGSYREASFCGTPDGVFYYIAGGKIYRATSDNAAPSTPFTSYSREGYGFYGAGIRVNPKTNELIATYLTEDYSKNLIVRFDGTTGEKISEFDYDGYYFPATVIFND